MLTFIDWFAGIGGFRRGMELAGHKCVGFCEFDKYAVASYTSMHLITERERERLATLDLKKRQKEILKEEYRHGEWFRSDVTRVYAGDIPRADVWCFGFPCQDISVAGYQKGFKGNRSSLFFRITGLLKELKEEDRPKYLFIENVKNLLSISRGYDFARLLVELDSIGYDAEWEVLNSKDFGVPQNRERCFIIGHLRGGSGREVFPLRRDATETDIQGAEVRNDMSNNLKFVDLCYDAQITDIARCLKARQDEGIQRHKGSSSGVLVPVNPEDDGTSRTIKYQYQKNSVPNFLDRGDRGATAVSDGFRVRKLTPKECFRLQGWTDDYFEKAEFVNSNAQLYKQAGNGVTVNVIHQIAKRFERVS